MTNAEGGAADKKGTPRQAHLRLSRIDPWSVMKFTFVTSVVCFLVLLVAVSVLYGILAGLGVFDSLSAIIKDFSNEQGGGGGEGSIDPGSWFSFLRIFGYTALIGALNILLFTALATVGAVIYNSVADIAGGIEVTLKEAE